MTRLTFTHWTEWASLAVVISFLGIVFHTCPPVHPQASNAQANQIEINAQVAYGLGYQSNTVLMNYVEPGTTTALFNETVTVAVPANTTNYPINLATMFPNINSAILYGVADISNPGQQFSLGMDSSGARLTIAPGGFGMWRVNGSAPTLYVDNPSSNLYCLIKVMCIGN